MNIRTQKIREALLTMLTPGNERMAATLAEAEAIAKALTALGFGPIELYVQPMISAPGVAEHFPLSEVEKWDFEFEPLNYAGASPRLSGFNIALMGAHLRETPDAAYQRLFDEFYPMTMADRPTIETLKLALPGVAEAVTAHLRRSLALAAPPAETAA